MNTINIPVTSKPEIPPGVCFIDLGNNKYQFYDELYPIIDLTYNLRMKLDHCRYLIHKYKCKIHDYFSDKDKIVIENIIRCTDIDNVTKTFFTRVLEENLIQFGDCSGTRINSFLNINNFDIFDDRVLYPYATKWMDLKQKPASCKNLDNCLNKIVDDFATINEKIITLTDSQLYFATTDTFNDRFDTQLHVCDAQKLSLADNDSNNLDSVNSLIDMYNNLPQICSMSLHDPISTESTHMWGLYGDNGHGIAVQYQLVSLSVQVLKCLNGISNPCWIDIVKYDNNFNPADEIKSCLQYFKETNKPEQLKHLNRMLKKLPFIKNKQWEHEKELRFLTLNIPDQQSFFGISLKESSEKLKSIKSPIKIPAVKPI